MATSPVWGIPYIAESQASPEVTHNTALNMLQMMDSGAQARQNAPPGSPTEGHVYIIGATPSGAWTGHANALAGRFGGGWVFVPGLDDDGAVIPMGTDHAGLTLYNVAEDAYNLWNGTAWVAWSYDVVT